MHKTTQFYLINATYPKIKMGLAGGMVACVLAPDAKIATALTIAFATAYTSRWAEIASRFIANPLGSARSGIPASDLWNIHLNKGYQHQIKINRQSMIRELDSAAGDKEKISRIRKKYETPIVKANGVIMPILTAASVIAACATVWFGTPVVSRFFAPQQQDGQLEPQRNAARYGAWQAKPTVGRYEFT